MSAEIFLHEPPAVTQTANDCWAIAFTYASIAGRYELTNTEAFMNTYMDYRDKYKRFIEPEGSLDHKLVDYELTELDYTNTMAMLEDTTMTLREAIQFVNTHDSFVLFRLDTPYDEDTTHIVFVHQNKIYDFKDSAVGKGTLDKLLEFKVLKVYSKSK